MLIRTTQNLLLLILLVATGLCTAENSTRISNHTIHHNAIPTAMLTPEIAGNYNIVRSKYRGLLNISVIREIPGTTGQAVSARVSAYATNLIGKRHQISLREIREGDAIYYIGDFPIVDGETLDFILEVTPEGVTQPARATLSQTFYID